MNKISTLILLFIIVLTSCQKEISINNGNSPTPNPTSSDSIYLSKVFYLDTSKIAPFDSLYIETYTYDNLKRVKTANFFDYTNGHIDSSNNATTMTYFYNGTDSLPFKRTDLTKSTNSLYSYTDLYTYLTGTSKLQIDSFIIQQIEPYNSNIQYQIYTYTYNTNSVIEFQKNYSTIGNFAFDTSSYYNIVKQNGNIISQSFTGSTTIPINTVQTGNASFNYDNKNNPYASILKISTYNLFISYDGLYELTSENVSQKNNLIEKTYSILSGTQTENGHIKYLYKYNNLNYPIENIIQDLNASTISSPNKTIYKYTN